MLNKSALAKDLEDVLNEPLPADDMNKDSAIRKKNKATAKAMANAIDKYVKGGSIDVKGLQWLPGTQVQTLPGQPVVNAPPIGGGAGATSGPGQALTSAPDKMIPPTGINCGKVY